MLQWTTRTGRTGRFLDRIPRRIALLVLLLAAGFISGSGPSTQDASASSKPDTVAELPSVAEAPAVDVAAAPPKAMLPEFAPISIDQLPVHQRAPSLSLVTTGTLSRGESLATALRSHGIDASVTHLLAHEMRPHFDFRRSQPGDRFRLEQDPTGEVVSFRYHIGPEESFHLLREGSGYGVDREQARLTPRLSRAAGVIDNSLYSAVRSLGEDPQLANDFADIFAWDIDFSRGVQPGDDFSILYERLYRTDEDGNEAYVRPGRILAARYRGAAGSSHTAIYFELKEGHGSYFRPDGSSVEREFLVAPLNFSRVTSRYSSARRHPILKVTRPHHGIDYAAATGTPLWSVSQGTVIYKGWGGGFGNLVKIRHSNGFVSYYAHLSRFAKGLAVGQEVEQKQVLGFVGQTGLATGPHVCFRVAKDGRYVNPHHVRSPAGSPVPDASWATFKVVRDSFLDDLDGRLMPATEEAL